ncbi:GNAT family N-acetyltransferase [Bacteroidota bacterium]
MSKWTVRYVTEDEYQTWDAFVMQNKDGTIFHTSRLALALLKVENNAHASIIGCFSKDGQLAGGMIVGWKQLPGKMKVMVTPYASPFSGPLVSARDTEYVTKQESHSFSILHVILDFVEREFNLVNFLLPTGFNDIRVFNWRNYSSRVFYTYVGEISDPEKLYKQFQSDIRRRITIAEKYSYSIKQNRSHDHVQIVYDLLSKSYERQDHPFKFTLEQFSDLLGDSDLKNNLSMYSVWNEDLPVAALLMLHYKDTAYYWMAGGDNEHFDTGLNQLLFWEVIKMMSELGLKNMNMVGANTPTISRYKSSYNFELVPYYSVTKIIGGIAKLAFGLKRMLK